MVRSHSQMTQGCFLTFYLIASRLPPGNSVVDISPVLLFTHQEYETHGKYHKFPSEVESFFIFRRPYRKAHHP